MAKIILHIDNGDRHINQKENVQMKKSLFENNDDSIRAILLANLEDEEELVKHPLYKAGFTAGVEHSEENYRKLTTALASVYNISEKG